MFTKTHIGHHLLSSKLGLFGLSWDGQDHLLPMPLRERCSESLTDYATMKGVVSGRGSASVSTMPDQLRSF